MSVQRELTVLRTILFFQIFLRVIPCVNQGLENNTNSFFFCRGGHEGGDFDPRQTSSLGEYFRTAFVIVQRQIQFKKTTRTSCPTDSQPEMGRIEKWSALQLSLAQYKDWSAFTKVRDTWREWDTRECVFHYHRVLKLAYYQLRLTHSLSSLFLVLRFWCSSLFVLSLFSGEYNFYLPPKRDTRRKT